MVRVFNHIAKQCGRGVDVVDDDVDVAVIKEIAKSRTSRRNYDRKAAAGSGWNFLKFLAVEISKQEWTLRPGGAPVCTVGNGIDMAVGNKNVQESIVVEIEKTGTPAKERYHGISETNAKGNVREIAIAVIAIEWLVVVRECGDEEIDSAIAIVVADGDPHRCLSAPLFAERNPRTVASILECPVMMIPVQVVCRRIVGNNEIYPAIVVNVNKDGSKTVATPRIRDAGLDTDVLKSAVTIVVK